MSHAPPFRFHDGGRKAAGFKGETGDCVCRAIAIAAELSYGNVYELLKEAASFERPRKGDSRSHPRTGVKIQTVHRIMSWLGWKWTPTMEIGSGCKVHVRADELPSGRLILSLSKHVAAFIDGELWDTSDISRGGTRCVYGYWSKEGEA